MVTLNRSLHTVCILIRLSCKEVFNLSKVPIEVKVIHSFIKLGRGFSSLEAPP